MCHARDTEIAQLHARMQALTAVSRDKVGSHRWLVLNSCIAQPGLLMKNILSMDDKRSEADERLHVMHVRVAEMKALYDAQLRALESDRDALRAAGTFA